MQNAEKIDPQVCGSSTKNGLQCNYKNPRLVKTTGYNVKSDCKPREGNTEKYPVNQPRPNSSECTSSESMRCKYGEETCCPNGGSEGNFVSLISRCDNISRKVYYTDACFKAACKPKEVVEKCNLPKKKMRRKRSQRYVVPSSESTGIHACLKLRDIM